MSEVLLDRDCTEKENLNIKRRNFKNKKERTKDNSKVLYKKVHLESYDFKFNKILNNYCYLILFYINYTANNMRVGNNVRILGDKCEIRNIVRKIKSEYLINDYLYKDLCPNFYDILFQFYLFDDTCPDIQNIILL